MLIRKKEQYHRSCWIKSGRTSGWWEKFVNGEVPESEWVDNFRMLRKSFEELTEKLCPFLEKQGIKMAETTSTEAQQKLVISRLQASLKYHAVLSL